MDKQACDECERMAVWQYAPADTYGSYCDGHVPRGCSCNQTWSEETGSMDGPEQVDDTGRLLPCVEMEFDIDGFPTGDREDVWRYRAANGYPTPATA